MRIRFLLAALILSLSPVANAQEPLWWFFEGPDTAGHLTTCPGSDVGGDVCLTFSCGTANGDTIRVYTWASHRPGRASALFSLDGRETMQANFSLDFLEDLGDTYLTPIDRATLLALMERMGRASQLAVRFDVTALNLAPLPAVPLAGSAPAIAQFVGYCGGQPAVASPSAAEVPPTSRRVEVLDSDPAADPLRYVPIARVAQPGPEAKAQARALLAGRIAENQVADADILADLIPFNDGQRVLLVSLCHPSNFGITGCETHLFHAANGAAGFSPVWGEVIGPGPEWLDLQSARDGLPDLVWGPDSVSPAYARWPMFGATFN